MKKNQILILAVVIVLIFGGIIGWVVSQKSKLPAPTGEGITPGEEKTPPKETFSLSAIVSSVDAQNNFLMVKPPGEEKEIKVIISETTSLVKFEFPFDPANPPEEATFTPKQTKIEISDFKVGDNVFIKTRTNIAGKSEFDDVDFVHILP